MSQRGKPRWFFYFWRFPLKSVIPEKGVFCFSKMLALYLEFRFLEGHSAVTEAGFRVAGKPFAKKREGQGPCTE